MKRFLQIQSQAYFQCLWYTVSAFFIMPSAWAQSIPATLSWTGETQGIIFSSPVIDDNGIVYVGSNDNNLTAFNTDGSIKWTFTTGNWVDSSPALSKDGSTVYAGSWDNHLYAVNTDDGSLNWSFETNSYITSSPAVDLNGRVYFGSMDSIFYALESNGSLAWEYFVGQPVFSSPAIGGNGTLYFGDENGTLHAVNPDGTIKWTYEVEDVVDTNKSILSSPAVDTSGNIYFGSGNGFCYSLSDDGDSASLNWKYETGDRVDSSPVLGINDEVFFVSRDGYMRSLPTFSATTENLPNWEVFVGDVFYSTPVVDENGRVYVIGYTGGGENHLFAYDANGSKAWDSNVSSPPFEIPSVVDSSLLLSNDGNLYFGCFDKKLYCLDIGVGPADSDWPMFRRNSFRDGDWPSFSLTIQSSPAVGGSTTGQGQFYEGSTPTITATPNIGYSFTGWNGTGVADPSASTTTVSMIEARTLSASFSINSYNLSLVEALGGSVSGSGTFDHGSTPTITATPNIGYSFTGWNGTGVTDPSASTTTVSMTEARTLSASFSINSYDLTLVEALGGSVSGSGTFDHGSTPTITATPNIGYSFTGWNGTGVTDPSVSTTTVSMTEARTLSASFSINSYDLSLVEALGGSVSGSGTFDHGSTPTITATPDIGYSFTGWNGTGVADPSSSSTTVSMTEARTLSASFSINSYELTLQGGLGGSVSGEGNYSHGSLVTITAVANSGYSFSGWSGMGVSDPNSPTTSVLLTENQTISAQFSEIASTHYLLTLQASPPHAGILTGGGLYFEDQNVSISASPLSGYVFDQWTGGSISTPEDANSSLIIDENLTLTALFNPLIFTVSLNNTNGGTVSGDGNYTYGTEANLSAIPSTGYKFEYWDGEGVDDPLNPDLSLIVQKNLTLEAVFSRKSYHLHTNPTTGGSIYISGNSPFLYDSNVSITAVSNPGYTFGGWIGEGILSESESNYFVHMTEDRNISAFFETIEASLIILKTPTTGGEVTGGGFYQSNQFISLSATHNPGYHFSHWLGAEVEEPLKANTRIFITSDAIAVASFSLSELSQTLEVSDLGNNWFSSWLGTIYQTGSGWIYHLTLGWLFPQAVESSLWLWTEKHGWGWTAQEPFSGNFLWLENMKEWVYLDLTSTHAPRYYNYHSESWVEW